MRIGIIANTTKYDISNFLVEFLKENSKHRDRKIILSRSTFNFVKSELEKNKLLKSVKSLDEKKFAGNIDLLLSFGGDGTMLYSAQYAIASDAILVGVNFGKLGFLADINYHDLMNVLDEYEKNDFEIETRILLEGKIVGHKSEKFIAVNDFVIEKGGWSRIIEIDTWVDGKFLTTYRSDGLIISTPTGSTGYSLSAGGPILLPELDSFVLSPICPHTLTVRPIVIPASSEIKIEAKSFYETVMINRDGQQTFKIKPPVKMIIRKSDKVLKLFKRKNKDYFQTLREKLMWGIDIREQNRGDKK
ncbi:MAG: NAD(+)/NADH kinase [Ignavibacteria bacterium]|nr:NAD(+)/NADH kinase [Ignavibacteria bacterium]MDH7527953.1 NAD(+)/NADH kinase [Ignavibacteria bacterium]